MKTGSRGSAADPLKFYAEVGILYGVHENQRIVLNGKMIKLNFDLSPVAKKCACAPVLIEKGDKT